MKTDYSKASSDIALEMDELRLQDQKRLEDQLSISRVLEAQPNRSKCLLCGANFDHASVYQHRHTKYYFCGNCGHVQTQCKLPPGYPHSVAGEGFETVYPRLEADAYASRRDRVYTPKLDWALSRISMVTENPLNPLKASWLEVGCGAGYFLSALQARGIEAFHGIDENFDLIATANEYCGVGKAKVTRDVYADIEQDEAQILVAFFVLEHLDDASRFWRILAEKKPGTMFLFSVPMFGLSTVLEGANHNFSARNLDSVIHTQLYTDESIDYALNETGYEKVAEWIFGQDAHDLARILINSLLPTIEGRFSENISAKISQLVDPIQEIVDRAHFSDARHVLALKK